MWGRANRAALVFILGTFCTFVNAEAGSVLELSNEMEAVMERATTWLYGQRNKDAGWGNDTHRVLLALRLANLSRDESIPMEPISVELQLSAKQMELEIVLLVWRCARIYHCTSIEDYSFQTIGHGDGSFTPFHLAQYSLALNAMCKDPRQFHGHDLIGTLQHHEPNLDYDFAFTTLAVCSAQAHVRKRQVRRLMDILERPVPNHDIDTTAMIILALRCIVQDYRHRNLHLLIKTASLNLAHRQLPDGSFGEDFGNIHSTALVLQALDDVRHGDAYSATESRVHRMLYPPYHEVDSKSDKRPQTNYWDRSAAIAWLVAKQRPDGSFEEDVKATTGAILGLSMRGLTTIRSLDCGQGLTEIAPPHLTTTNDIAAADNHSEIMLLSPTGNNGTSPTEVSVTAAPEMVNVSYTLWVGSKVNETYNLMITVPKNETFYTVMVSAAEMSPHFQFAASEWPNGHYVHTLAGYKEEPMSYHYWLLYRLPSPPEATSPPGNMLVAPGGVDDLQINEGEHYLFWYKKL